MSVSQNESQIVIVNETLNWMVVNFEFIETPSGFWVKGKPDSSHAAIYCPLDSPRFSCLLKYQAVEQIAQELSAVQIRNAIELFIGKNSANWSTSTELTHAIESDVVAEAIISWSDHVQRSNTHAPPSDGSHVYSKRFQTFYDELLTFATTNHLIKRGCSRFPGSSSVLSRRIRECAGMLREAGLIVSLPPRDKHGARIKILMNGDASQPERSNDGSSGLNRDNSGAMTGDASDCLMEIAKRAIAGGDHE